MMHGLKISPSGCLRTVEIQDGQIPAGIGCVDVIAIAAHHGIQMWVDATYSTDAGLVNAAAMTVLLNCSPLAPAEIPLITGDVVVLAVDAAGASVSLTADQLHVLGSAVLASLAA
jgi:hypothetical protein